MKRKTTTLRALGELVHSYVGVLLSHVIHRMDHDAAEVQNFRNRVHQPFMTKAEVAARQTFTPGVEATP